MSCVLFFVQLLLMILWVAESHHVNSTANATIKCPIRSGLMTNPESACDHYFYNCDEFVGYRKICPVDLFFDLQIKACDEFAKVQDCSGIPRTTAATTTIGPSISTISTIDSRLIYFCMKKRDGDYPDELNHNCSNRFFTCSSGMLYVKNCRDGDYFDPEFDWCNSRENVFACTGVQHTTHPTTISPVPFIFNCFDKENGRLYPDPEQPCSHHFFMCSGGYANRMTCSAMLYFDEKLQDCTYEQDVPECDKLARNSKPISTKSTVTASGRVENSTRPFDLTSGFSTTSASNSRNLIGTTLEASSSSKKSDTSMETRIHDETSTSSNLANEFHTLTFADIFISSRSSIRTTTAQSHTSALNFTTAELSISSDSETMPPSSTKTNMEANSLADRSISISGDLSTSSIFIEETSPNSWNGTKRKHNSLVQRKLVNSPTSDLVTSSDSSLANPTSSELISSTASRNSETTMEPSQPTSTKNIKVFSSSSTAGTSDISDSHRLSTFDIRQALYESESNAVTTVRIPLNHTDTESTETTTFPPLHVLTEK